MKLRVILLSTIAFTLVGCAHTPTMGEKMGTHSSAAKELSVQWEEGNRLVLNGESLQAKGNKLISKGESMQAKGRNLAEKGRAMISEGKQNVDQGTRQKSTSEMEYNAKFPTKIE